MRKIDLMTWSSAVLVLLTAAVGAHTPTQSLVALVDAVLRHGPESQLPAHLSLVLGVGSLEQSTPVKQAVLRDGQVVRTFNVCTGRHDDVVLINYDEQTRSSKVFLASPSGRLRKAVFFQAGASAVDRPVAQARSDFAIEIKYWTALGNAPGGLK